MVLDTLTTLDVLLQCKVVEKSTPSHSPLNQSKCIFHSILHSTALGILNHNNHIWLYLVKHYE